jgi:nitroreductase
MDAIEAIFTRRSIRKYLDKPVPVELVEKLLAAAMQAPSARNQQPWRFVVIDDRAILDEIPGFMPNAAMIAGAPLGILVCGDLALEKSSGYWVVDCSAAAQNILLAAHALGLGAVWTGVYPREKRMEGLRQLIGLPENVMAHSLVVIGYPAEQVQPADRFLPDRIRRNRWFPSPRVPFSLNGVDL